MRMTRDIFLMGNQYNGVATGMYMSEDLHDLVRGFGIQVTRRFIRKNDRGVIYQSSRNSHTLGLAAT
jgi:hypothetical protein